MLSEKLFTFTIELTAKETYEGDEIIMEKLRKYEKKCMNNAYIVKIVKITHRTSKKITSWATDGSSNMDITCLAEVIEYHKGDLVLCNIVFIEKSKLIFGKLTDVILIKISDVNLNIKTGAWIIVEVEDVVFNQYNEFVMINGNQYSEKEPVAYKLTGEIAPETKAFVVEKKKIDNKNFKAEKGTPLWDFAKYDAAKTYSYVYDSVVNAGSAQAQAQVMTIDVNTFLLMAYNDYSKKYDINSEITAQNIKM